jgi:cell division inhibitor SepF
MASGIMRKAMVFLGLDDEEAEDYDAYEEAEVAPQPPRRYQQEAVHAPADDRALTGVRTMPREHVQEQSGSVRVTASPPPVRPISPPPTPRVQIVVPTRFADAQEVGEHCKSRTPVIVNLKEADGALSRRMIDFCSGVTYALGGSMEKVADQVFLLTPESIEVPAEERRRLQEKGFHDS